MPPPDSPSTGSRAAASVIRPGSLVEYQDGSIVSRVLLKTAAGSVTLFAFDEQQSLSEHRVPHDALVQVIDGELEIVLSGTAHRLRGGDGLIMRANQPHAVRALSRVKMMLTMLRA